MFEDQPICTAWDVEHEDWLVFIVDVVRVLTDQPNTRRAAKYWSVLKTKLKKREANCLQIVVS